MIPTPITLDAEDAASLISFIDYFLPMVNTSDADSKQVALTIHEVRNTVHDALDVLGVGDELSRTDFPS